jgi:hypothetical protein
MSLNTLSQIKAGIVWLASLLVLLLSGFSRSTLAAEDDSGSGEGDSTKKAEWRYRGEYKKRFTDRGMPGENTRSTVRFEALPDSPLSLIRLDIPFMIISRPLKGILPAPISGISKYAWDSVPFLS